MQADLLKDVGIQHFDEWAADFGEVVTDFEYILLCSENKCEYIGLCRGIPLLMPSFSVHDSGLCILGVSYEAVIYVHLNITPAIFDLPFMYVYLLNEDMYKFVVKFLYICVSAHQIGKLSCIAGVVFRGSHFSGELRYAGIGLIKFLFHVSGH